MKFLSIIAVLFVLPNLLNAKEISLLVKELNLYPGTKASVQWERIFSTERRQKKYGIYHLSDLDKKALKKYLIKYAADSDQPIVPGL